MYVADDELSLVGDKNDPQYRLMDYPAQKGDEFLKVDFFKRVHEGQERDWIRITIPNNACTIDETVVEEHHKQRFVQKWNEYQGYSNAKGTDINQWTTDIGEAMVREFIRKDFNFIEQVSLAPDSSLNGLPGGGAAWRKKAIDFLQKGKPDASATIDRQAAEIAELKEQMATMMEMLNNKPKYQQK